MTPEIPTLDLDMQATELVAPVTKWGSIARSSRMDGTYHFLCDDYKFRALWDRPDQLPDSGCQVAVEVNYSTFPETTRPYAIRTVYCKRVLARYWQMRGVKIVVDLNVDPAHLEVALLGVPAGWLAYATRVHALGDYEEIERQRALAAKHSGTDDLRFWVFGGGRSAGHYCQHRGWTHIPEAMHIADGRLARHGERLEPGRR